MKPAREQLRDSLGDGGPGRRYPCQVIEVSFVPGNQPVCFKGGNLADDLSPRSRSFAPKEIAKSSEETN